MNYLITTLILFVTSMGFTQDSKNIIERSNDDIKVRIVKKIEGENAILTGAVLNAKTDSVLVGMNIVLMGHRVGTVTDKKGSFRLECPSQKGQLRFFFVGYETLLVDY